METNDRNYCSFGIVIRYSFSAINDQSPTRYLFTIRLYTVYSYQHVLYTRGYVLRSSYYYIYNVNIVFVVALNRRCKTVARIVRVALIPSFRTYLMIYITTVKSYAFENLRRLYAIIYYRSRVYGNLHKPILLPTYMDVRPGERTSVSVTLFKNMRTKTRTKLL